MLISPEQVYWLLFNSQKLDDKLILKLAKSKGIKVPDSMRKNLYKEFHQKRNVTITTTKNIINLTSSVINNPFFPAEQVESNSLIEFSNPKDYLIYLEEQYQFFIKAGDLENSLVENEIRNIIKSLERLFDLKDSLTHDNNSASISLDSKTIAFDFNHDYFIDLSASGVFGFEIFSLNISIYLLCCLQLQISPNQEILGTINKYLLSEIIKNKKINEPKQSFWYYTELWKRYKNISFQEMSDELGIPFATFNAYRSRGRKINNIQHIHEIWMKGGVVYFVAVFIKKFIDLYTEEESILFFSDAYEKYYSLANDRYNRWSPSTEREPAIS